MASTLVRFARSIKDIKVRDPPGQEDGGRVAEYDELSPSSYVQLPHFTTVVFPLWNLLVKQEREKDCVLCCVCVCGVKTQAFL